MGPHRTARSKPQPEETLEEPAVMATRDGLSHFSLSLAGVLIVIFAAQIYFESRTKSPSSDEPPHIASGLSYVETGIFRGNLQHPPLLKELSGFSLRLGGVHWPRNPETENFLRGDFPPGLPPEWAIGNKIITDNGPDRVMFWARLPLLLIACLLAAVVYLWGRQVLGGLAALGALILCTLDPVILGHAGFVTMDVGMAAFTALFFLALWNYIRYPTGLRLVLSGLALGAVLGAKFSAVLLIPVAAVLLLAAVVWPVEAVKPSPAGKGAKVGRNEKCPCGSGKKYKACHGAETRALSEVLSSPQGRRRFGLCALAFLAICAVAFVVVQAVYFFPADPLIYYRGLKQVNADHNADYQPFLAGEFQSRFTGYFAAAYLLKEPIAGILLAGIGFVALLRSHSIPVIGKMFILLPPAVLFVGHTVLADNLGIRYLIPAFPFVHLAGGLGLATLWRMTARWGRFVAAALCGWLVLAAAGVYPDHLSYFNEAACLLQQPDQIGVDGGTRCGPLWLDDSNVDWGQGFKQLKAWLDKNEKGRTIRVISSFGFPPEVYNIPTEALSGRELTDRPPGLYAVSAHVVARGHPMSQIRNWLQTAQPVAIVGHALYIYDLP
jgi:hypothetical protein